MRPFLIIVVDILQWSVISSQLMKQGFVSSIPCHIDCVPSLEGEWKVLGEGDGCFAAMDQSQAMPFLSVITFYCPLPLLSSVSCRPLPITI